MKDGKGFGKELKINKVNLNPNLAAPGDG